MTLGEVLSTPLGYMLRILAIVFFYCQYYECVVAINQKVDRRFVVVSTALLLFSFVFFVGMIENLASIGENKGERLPIVLILLEIPWIYFAAYEGFQFVFFVFSIFWIKRYTDTRLANHSIKQAIDMLPLGVYVGNAEKTYLINLTMQDNVKIWKVLFTNAEDFWNCVVAESKESGESRIVDVENKTLLFSKSTFEIEGKEYTKITSQDVTERAKKTKELFAVNNRLKGVLERVKNIKNESEELAKAKEFLSTKTRVHDEMGHILLLGKYYFDSINVNEEELLENLKKSNSILLNDKDAEYEEDEYAEAVRLSNVIGIEVESEGDIPKDKEIRHVLAISVKECAANAVKHAEAKTLFVRSRVEDERTVVEISNDGAAPLSVVPTGGLKSLISTIEEIGECSIESRPAFKLTIFIKNDRVIDE